jgi:hypothetical protein
MDYSSFQNISTLLGQFWEVALSFLGLGLLWLILVLKKDVKKVREHLIREFPGEEENKNNLIQLEKDVTQVTEELDTLKTTNPTLYLQVGRQSLYLKNQLNQAESVKGGATN